MRIRSKLILAAIINVCLIFVFSFIVVYNVKTIATRFNDVADTTTPAIILLNGMSENFYTGAGQALAYPLTGNMADKNGYEESMRAFDVHENELFDLVSGGNTVAPKEDTELLEKINVALTDFKDSVVILFAHYEREGRLFMNHSENEAKIDIQDIERVRNKATAMKPYLQKWVNMEKEEVLESQEKVEYSVNQTQIIATVVGLIAFFVSLIFSLWLLISISRPLTNLKNTANTISEGNITVQAEVINNDEFGDLAASFNHMTSELLKTQSILELKVKERTTELENERQSLENKVKERTDELEKLKAGLEEAVEEKTKTLQNKIVEVQSMNKMMVDRELKMVEMKKELEDLKKKVS